MADSDNSAACFIHPQKATDNYLRAVKLLSKVCIEIVRIVFSFYIPPNSLKDTLQHKRCILENKLLNEEKTLIYPNARVNPLLTAKDFDIGVMIKILKELNFIKPCSRRWDRKPRKGDTSIAACMQIIKNGRDEISHTKDGELNDEKFENIWKKLEFAVIEMEKHLIGGTFFKKAVEYVKTCKLDQSEEDQHDNKTSNVIDSDGTAIETGEAYISDMGLEIRFAKLFKEIAKSIPQDKLEEMKDIIQISCKDVNTVDLKRAVSANDCLKAVKEANHFTSTNVIYMQYVLDTIGCGGLFEKCVEYAKGQDALCYHKVQTENGLIVHIHVPGNLSNYKQSYIDKIKQTVAEMVECTVEKIQLVGIRPSDSFLIVLFLKNVSLRKLWTMKQQDKDKLLRLNIDYIVADLNFVFLERSKDLESQWKMYFGPKIRRQYTKDAHWKEAEMITPTVVEKPTESQTPEEKKLKKTLDYNTSDSLTRHTKMAKGVLVVFDESDKEIDELFERLALSENEDESKSCSGELPEASQSNKQLKKVLDTMWNTVLNHGYGYSPSGGSLAKKTYLVCKIDGVPRPIIKENDDDTHVHAEHILIDYLEKENVVTQNNEGIHADKTLQDNLEEKPLIQKKITVYINNSPCFACAEELKDYLEKNQHIHLTLYVTHLYMIKRKSCQDRADKENESHMYRIDNVVHRLNYQGLRDLLSLGDNRCKIEAFTEDVWRELGEVMGFTKYFQQKYGDQMASHDRSREEEDTYIKEDLIHLQEHVDPWHGIKI